MMRTLIEWEEHFIREAEQRAEVFWAEKRREEEHKRTRERNAQLDHENRRLHQEIYLFGALQHSKIGEYFLRDMQAEMARECGAKLLAEVFETMRELWGTAETQVRLYDIPTGTQPAPMHVRTAMIRPFQFHLRRALPMALWHA